MEIINEPVHLVNSVTTVYYVLLPGLGLWLSGLGLSPTNAKTASNSAKSALKYTQKDFFRYNRNIVFNISYMYDE